MGRLLQWRIKARAGIAGLFRPQEAWKDWISLPISTYKVTQSNNYVIVPVLMGTWDAMVDWWIMHLNTSKAMVLSSKSPIHIPEIQVNPVRIVHMEWCSKTLVSQMCLQIIKLHYKRLLLYSQYRLLLKLIRVCSSCTLQESLLQVLVELHWIMVCWQLDTVLLQERHIGRWKTLGDLLGVIRDMFGFSDHQALMILVFVVLLWWHRIQQ